MTMARTGAAVFGGEPDAQWPGPVIQHLLTQAYCKSPRRAWTAK